MPDVSAGINKNLGGTQYGSTASYGSYTGGGGNAPGFNNPTTPTILPTGTRLAPPGASTGPIAPVTSMLSSPSYGAGQGPTPSTGQAADNPFANTFNFQIPQPSSGMGDGSTTGSTTPTASGVSGYLPLIIVGVVVAGIAYYAFERKKR
jgi:hypothetical protein